jgi:hypothetical protein
MDAYLGDVGQLDQLIVRRQPKLEPRRAQPESEERGDGRFDFRSSGDDLHLRNATVSVAPRVNVNVLWVIYLVAGGIVSATHHYWSHLHAIKPVVSAILAVVLWPLLLVGINLRIH